MRSHNSGLVLFVETWRSLPYGCQKLLKSYRHGPKKEKKKSCHSMPSPALSIVCADSLLRSFTTIPVIAIHKLWHWWAAIIMFAQYCCFRYRLRFLVHKIATGSSRINCFKSVLLVVYYECNVYFFMNMKLIYKCTFTPNSKSIYIVNIIYYCVNEMNMHLMNS